MTNCIKTVVAKMWRNQHCQMNIYVTLRSPPPPATPRKLRAFIFRKYLKVGSDNEKNQGVELATKKKIYFVVIYVFTCWSIMEVDIFYLELRSTNNSPIYAECTREQLELFSNGIFLVYIILRLGTLKRDLSSLLIKIQLQP